MGRYLNPGGEGFKVLLNSDICVDKTGLLKYVNSVINTTYRYLCVSRPRRFGKTTTMNMLSAYYGVTVDGADIFKDMKIAQDRDYKKHLNKYNIIKVEVVKMGLAESSVDKWVAKLRKVLMYDFKKTYPDLEFIDEDDFIMCMEDVYEYTGKKFIILIDEWDVLFRERENDVAAQKQYLDFLRMWLKDQDYIALAYMTGILPVKKYGKHSALNMFKEYSMENPRELQEFVGFTADEVKQLCLKYGMDYRQCKAWYDGYTFLNVKEIYNPLSVVEAMTSRYYANYWNKTETFEALKVYIDLNYDGLKDSILTLMAGERRKIVVDNFSNDMVTFNSADDVMTLLIHLGYLGYDIEREEVFIPNNEIRAEFAAAVRNNSGYAEVAKAIKTSDELLEATIACDAEKVAQLIENAHLETSHIQYNDENALSYTISLAYYTARKKYNIIREMPAGKGFADMIFLPLPHHPELPAMIIELKWDKSAETAISQIENKKYSEALKGYEENILLVGINYDKTTRKHFCEIKRG